jgi:PAS domain S-box-containing protein
VSDSSSNDTTKGLDQGIEETRFARGETTGKLPDEPQLYRLLVQSVRDYAIFALDARGYVATWNRGAQRLKGYTPEEIIGKHFRIFYPPEDIAARKPDLELAEAVRVGRVEDEGWRIRKDGTRFWASGVITAVHDASGQLVGFAKVTRDLSERRAAEQRAIDDARRISAVELANLAKTEFLAAMSHELRTPLNAIGGYADLLALGIHGSLTAQQSDYVQRIRRSQQHLLGIINDLLNYTRLEAGEVAYELRLVALAGIVANVIPMIEPQTKNRGLELSAKTNEGLFALADPAKVEQIVLNLLSNAVKFTPAGGRVSVETFRDGERAVIRVSDTGIGIPSEKLGSIFEPFVQVGRSLKSPHEGTGLGLAISRDLARAMNGDLIVKSQLGVGSVFDLSLPATEEGSHSARLRSL